MNIGVLGSGLMGKEAARDLVESSSVTTVGLADLDFNRAKTVCEQIQSQKLTPFQVDARNEEELANFMSQLIVLLMHYFTRLMKSSQKQQLKWVFIL